MMRTRPRQFVCLAILPFLSGCSLLFGEGRGVRGGLTYSFADFSRFQGMVGDQEGIASAYSDETINQLGIMGEVTAGPWWYGTELRFGQHEFTQAFQPGSGRPDEGYGTVDGLFIDFSGGRRLRITPRVTGGVWTGPTFTYNVARLNWEYGDDLVEDERSLTNTKWGLGGYIALEPRKDWSLRLSFSHYSLNSDADDHNLFKIGVLKDFRAGTEFYRRPGKGPGRAYEKAIVARLDSVRRSTGRAQR